MVELNGIGKYFSAPGVQALDNADFDLLPGEIHALVGENGAGKSTLMHIMAGYLSPGAGVLRLDGRERRFRSPADALAAGIGMVRQHPSLVPGFRVWEDCILGGEPRRGPFLNRRAARALVKGLSERWGFGLPIESPTERLTVSLRQKAAILALLLRGARYFVFDEPTAVLTPGETEGLFALFSQLRSEGKGIVLISHKLEETLALADRVTVLREGRTVAVSPAAALDQTLIFGSRGDGGSGPSVRQGPRPLPDPEETRGRCPRRRRAEAPPVPPLLRIRRLSVELPGRPFIRGAELALVPGTILGIAGVRDSGLETLELAITGFVPVQEGTVEVNGQDVTGKGPAAFRAAGAAYLGAAVQGSAPALSLRDNLIIHAHRRFRRGPLGLMDRSSLDGWVRQVLSRARLPRSATAAAAATAATFSGGMLRRAVLAREFAENAPLLVLAEPGWGLDRSSRDALLGELRDYARGGGGVLVFSTDTEELSALCDEIRVLRNGRFSGGVIPEGPALHRAPALIRALRDRIGRLMVGAHA